MTAVPKSKTRAEQLTRMFLGYEVPECALARVRLVIKTTSRAIYRRRMADLIVGDVRAVEPWNGTTPIGAALAAAKALLWEAERAGLVRRVPGRWSDFWVPIR